MITIELTEPEAKELLQVLTNRLDSLELKDDPEERESFEILSRVEARVSNALKECS